MNHKESQPTYESEGLLISAAADSVRARQLTEFRYRVGLLGAEVDSWVGRAEADPGGFGIHRSQLNALRTSMVVWQAGLDGVLGQFPAGLSPPEFAYQFRSLVRRLTALQDLWGIYRTIFLRRADRQFRHNLDTADLTAADCYQSVLLRAVARLGLDADEYIEPPVVHPTPSEFPTAVYRDLPAHWLGARILKDNRVPIPVVTVPEDHVGCVWLLALVPHEVGHLLDRELGVGTAVKLRLQESGGPGRLDRWLPWRDELIADMFGVLLGGPGFVVALAQLLSIVGPALSNQPGYPPFRLRLHLLAALLEGAGGPLRGEQTFVRELAANDGGAEIGLEAEVACVAAACLTAPLVATGASARQTTLVSELVPDVPTAWDQSYRLADFLRTGKDRPAPEGYPWRLVPPAAQLAVWAAAGTPANLRAINDRATEFRTCIPAPGYMAGGNRDLFYQSIAMSVEFNNQ